MRRFVVEVVVSTIATLIATLVFATLPSPRGPAVPSETRPAVQALVPPASPASALPFAIDAELLWPSADPKPAASHPVMAAAERSGRAMHRTEHPVQPRTVSRTRPACDPAAGGCGDSAPSREILPAVQPVVAVVMPEPEPILQRPKRLLLSAASDALDFGQGLIRTVHSAAGNILPN